MYRGFSPKVAKASLMLAELLMTKFPRPSYARVRALIINGYVTFSAILETDSGVFVPNG
jgi:hypothetical protein